MRFYAFAILSLCLFAQRSWAVEKVELVQIHMLDQSEQQQGDPSTWKGLSFTELRQAGSVVLSYAAHGLLFKFNVKPSSDVRFLFVGGRGLNTVRIWPRAKDTELATQFAGPSAGSANINIFTKSPVLTIPPHTTEIQGAVEAEFVDQLNFLAVDQTEFARQLEVSRAIFYIFTGATTGLILYQLATFFGTGEIFVLWYLLACFFFCIAGTLITGALDYYFPLAGTRNWFSFVWLAVGFCLFCYVQFLGAFFKNNTFSGQKIVARITTTLTLAVLVLGVYRAINPYSFLELVPYFDLTIRIFTLILCIWIGSLIYSRVEHSRTFALSILPVFVFVAIARDGENTFAAIYSPLLILIPALVQIFSFSFVTYNQARNFKLLSFENATQTERGDFLAHVVRLVSHDLSNHFFVVKGFLEINIKKSTEPQIIENSKKSLQSLKRAMELLARIKTWTASGVGRVDIEIAPVNLKAAIQDSIDTLGQVALDKGIAINVNVPEAPNGLFVNAERVSLLNHVLNNALSNAIKFSQPNDRIDIEVHSKISGM